MRDGRRLIEYTTPIYSKSDSPEQRVRVGIVSLGLSMEGLEYAQRSIRQQIFKAAAVILVAAFFGTLLLSSFITTPVKRLHRGVLSLASSETFQPVPARSSDELGALTRNFNRMAETILAQKTDLQKKALQLEEANVSLQEKALQLEEANVSLQEKGLQLEEAYVSMVRVLAASLDARDPVHDGALHPRGADGVRAGEPPRDGRGGAFRPGAGGDLPRPREDGDP